MSIEDFTQCVCRGDDDEGQLRPPLERFARTRRGASDAAARAAGAAAEGPGAEATGVEGAGVECAVAPAAAAVPSSDPFAPPRMPSAAVVQLMANAWSADPARRPPFAAIKALLDDALAALDES